MHSPSFADLGVAPDAVSDLAARGIDAPFPIQAATLPDALAGRDVAGKAPTGSGKTLAFGLAIVARCERARPHRPTALVLVPTRELAGQVAGELRLLARTHRLRVATVYGGVGFGPQRKALREGVDVLVACPGRLADLINQGDVRLDDVAIAVVDEADRMADMGFLPEVRRLLDQTRSDRQTLLFSATLDGAVDVLVSRYQRNPATHEVAVDGDAISDATHFFWRIAEADRVERAADAIKAAGPTIVFCRTRHRADRVAKRLGTAGRGRGGHPRRPFAAPARPGAARLHHRAHPRPGRHRRGRPRASTSTTWPRSSTSTCRPTPRTTSTARAAPPAPARPAWSWPSWPRTSARTPPSWPVRSAST